MIAEKSTRRYDIDWLRVLLFGLLIPFHVAVGLVWNYGEAFSNQENTIYQTELVLENLILLWMHNWRLPALFMISGMGTAFAARKRDAATFRRERFDRLVIPFLFGSFVVNLPFWWISAWSDDPSLAQLDLVGTLVAAVIVAVVIGFINTITLFELGLHLWFLRNLFIYSLLLSLVLNRIKMPTHVVNQRFRRLISSRLGFLLILPLPLLIIELSIKPISYGDTGHGYEFLWYLVFFVLGFLLIISKKSYFAKLEQLRKLVSFLAPLFSVLLITLILLTGDRSVYLLNGSWVSVGYAFVEPITVIASVLHTYHAWFWCLFIFSWVSKLLNSPSPQLTYLNQAVYPLYIWHMSFVFIGLYAMKPLILPLWIKFILGTGFTLIMSFMGVELVKKTEVTRRLFGIKEIVSKQKPIRSENTPMITCPNCSFSLPSSNRYCTQCGQFLEL